MIESVIYYSVKAFGVFIRALPVSVGLFVGRAIGILAYTLDVKHKSQVYANLKTAFAKTKTPAGIRKIAEELFQNYGQNLIELLRMPLLNKTNFHRYVTIEGDEHVKTALQQGKGVILLAMHNGSWEYANMAFAMMDNPYKVIVKPQKRFSRLDELLNSYRGCGGAVVIERGMGTRDFIRSLHNNEVVGMVVDQGGRTGMLVPFFERQASMSVGAIRMGLKFGVPICFSIIMREGGARHRLIIHEPLDLQNTGDVDADVRAALTKITAVMEDYIRRRPQEYMWFYKIWKYSRESTTLILHDGKTGHLRQSQCVARMVQRALAERQISSTETALQVVYKSPFAAKLMAVCSLFTNDFIFGGRLEFLRWFLTKECYEKMASVSADFIISCGSLTAPVNSVLSGEQQAKSIVVLKPGFLGWDRFDLAVMPEHDCAKMKQCPKNIVRTNGAPNLISKEYIEEQKTVLLKRFSHLKIRDRLVIGLLLGGDTKDYLLPENKVKVVLNQLKMAAEELNADILISTSRRTSAAVENLLQREMKRHPQCPLLILANRNNVPEAMGGILGLADILVVSGDSVSMISEAASSGKKVVVFPIERKQPYSGKQHKHVRFIDRLNEMGYILSSDAQNLRHAVGELAKNKIQTRTLDDQARIFEAVQKII